MLDHVAVSRVLAHFAERKAPPATANLTRAALRGMARTRFRLRLIPVDERQRIDDVPAAKGTRELRGWALDDKSLRKLFVAAARDATAAGRRDAALLAVCYGAGLRRAEASALDVSDYRDGTLRVMGKGNKQSPAPIGPDAGAAVEAWLAVRGVQPGPLFLAINKAGKVGRARLSGRAVSYAVHRAAERAAIAPTAPHDLRRSFVTNLLEAGEDLLTVAKAARHASPTTTSRYDRRDGKRVAAAVGRLKVPFRSDHR